MKVNEVGDSDWTVHSHMKDSDGVEEVVGFDLSKSFIIRETYDDGEYDGLSWLNATSGGIKVDDAFWLSLYFPKIDNIKEGSVPGDFNVHEQAAGCNMDAHGPVIRVKAAENRVDIIVVPSVHLLFHKKVKTSIVIGINAHHATPCVVGHAACDVVVRIPTLVSPELLKERSYIHICFLFHNPLFFIII